LTTICSNSTRNSMNCWQPTWQLAASGLRS